MRYAAILWDIPWGQDWEYTCRHTPGHGGRVPDECRNKVINEWGIWFDDSDYCTHNCPVGAGLKPETAHEDCEKAGRFWDDKEKQVRQAS
jgi:hypothetical protein